MNNRAPLASPIADFHELAPYRARLVDMKTACKPYGLDWQAVDQAIVALDHAALRLTGRRGFYTAPRMVSVIGEIGAGGAVTFYAHVADFVSESPGQQPEAQSACHGSALAPAGTFQRP